MLLTPELTTAADPDRTFAGTRVPLLALFESAKRNEPLDAFLADHPDVTRAAAVAAYEDACAALGLLPISVIHPIDEVDPWGSRLKVVPGRWSRAIEQDREVMSGRPCFVGTRVPARALFDYLQHDRTLDYFLGGFPSVLREQATIALDESCVALGLLPVGEIEVQP